MLLTTTLVRSLAHRNATATAPIALHQHLWPSVSRRTLSSSVPDGNACEWLVIFPDHPGVLDRRLAIRPKHSPNFVRLHNEGYVSWAGPIFERHAAAGAKRPFIGSVMVVNAETPEAILQRLKSDPYIQERIWDLEKTRFIPIQTRMRKALGSD